MTRLLFGALVAVVLSVSSASAQQATTMLVDVAQGSKINTDIAALNAEIVALKAQIAAGIGEINILKAQIADLQARVLKLESGVVVTPVNCVGTWSACVDGSQTFTVTTPASGGGLACPASPRSCTVTTPVNCQGTWSACVNGFETFTVTTAPANGGQACPASPRACAIDPPPPPTGGGNAYFDTLVKRSDFYKAYSLRDPKQLAVRNDGGYSWTNDRPPAATYDATMDAARVVVPAGLNSLPNQVRVPVGTQDGNSYLVTWDAYYDPSFRYANHGINNYKTYQFSSMRRAGDLSSTNIWFEVNNRWIIGECGELRGRYYWTAETPGGPGLIAEPLGPRLTSFVVKCSTWTRHWALFEQKVGGDAWTRMTLWVADAARGPIKIFDRLPFTTPGGIQHFWLEFNTSDTAIPAGRGPLTAYVKNVVFLRNPTNVAAVLVKP